MRLGLVSDVHCNLASFERALDELGPDVDEVLLLGDLIHEYRFSNEVVGRALDDGLRYVLGNHELGFLKNPAAVGRPGVDQVLVGKLRDVPLRIDLEIAGKRLCIVHASPFAPYNDYLFSGSPLLRRCSEIDADFLLLGHTHVPMAERHGGTLVVNPGSIGESRDPGSSTVSYAILDTVSDDVELRRFPNPAYGVEGPTVRSTLGPA
ncbi:metallophosphoesterase family protein [Pseudonocardia kunmingensis]|uniref:Putative phosphoesterase n=1 Tax=Pseudonocardia kunmingensis TaxID=630975 RepID=A0A543DPC9_9PSEU|nr:metallophosphoesterase family protein [Pseudonocardia kunmingensis]TQM11192.1 putative phosphoesterase [Pseudonocardia kunmingensis]